MGGKKLSPILYLYNKKIMKIQKKLVKESVGVQTQSKKSFSEKSQNIVITEKQLEKLLENLKR